MKMCINTPSVNNSEFKGEVGQYATRKDLHIVGTFMRLQSLVDMMVDKEAEQKKEPKKRSIDEVSLDEDGYPKELLTPSTKEKPLTKGSPDSNNT